MASSETSKLNQHLALLKEEYLKLQTHCTELERKYSLAAANSGDLNGTSFVSRLLLTVATLYGKDTYSDVKIKLAEKTVPAHKFVLNARSDEWSQESLKSASELDWSHLANEIGDSVLRWIYTDIVDFHLGDSFSLALMNAAHKFHLAPLQARCERALIAEVTVRNCVQFYSAADEIGADELREHCSGVISAHWEDLTGDDFSHMSSPLLYQMLKRKSSRPLHSAVRLRREDVLFLCLVENNANLGDIVNAPSSSGELPLELALYSEQPAMAMTLLQHGAEVNVRGSLGTTPLHRAISSGRHDVAQFLLDHKADVNLTTSPAGDSCLHLIAAWSPPSTDHVTLEGALKVATRLLELGADPNLQNQQGLTALHISIMSQNEDIFDLLLSQPSIDLNVKTIPDQHTALYYALLRYHPRKGNSNIATAKQLAEKLIDKNVQTNPIYSELSNSLMHVMVQENLEDAAIFLSPYIKNINHSNLDGDTILHYAAGKGLDRLVTTLLYLGSLPNVQNNEARQTPLHTSVVHNRENSIVSFIEYKNEMNDSVEIQHNQPNFNVKDKEGETPISLALTLGHLNLVSPLILGGSDVNVRNAKGFTLLHQAILKEDSDTAIFLLDQGADMNSLTNDNETPLQLAIHCRLESVVESLCSRGVSLSAPDPKLSPSSPNEGPIVTSSPLWCALESEQESVAAILVRYGVDTDCWGPGPEGCLQTLLHRAIDENKDEIAIFLIQSACDLDSPRQDSRDPPTSELAKDKHSPLHLCCQWGLENVVQALLEHGANVNSRDADSKTPLHIAIENQHPSIITLLLCHPSIDLTVRDKSGTTPFAAALTVRNHKAAQAIVDRYPAAAEQTDTRGRNFLHTAILKGDVESVLFLLAIQVDVNSRVQDADQTPPLHLAAISGNEMLLRSLVLAGARVDDRDAHKQTALHIASEHGHSGVVAALLQNGADFDAVNSEGDNALHIAVRNGHLQVARELLTESSLNAEAINLKGRNPLHELCRCDKENTAAICELFLECMPNYPINVPDLQGNSPLLLAYIRGQGTLCRVLVRAGACLGAENKDGVNIFNYQVATKQLLHRLLDQLNQESPWAESDLCQECGTKFSLTMRKHHCRHCGRILCKTCSGQDVPILKFGLNKPVRVCGVCFDVLQIGSG